MFRNPFRRKPQLTTMEEFGTPWSVFLADGTVRHPEDTYEAITYLLDCNPPALAAPVTLVYERNTAGMVACALHDALCVDSYAQALPFIAEHAAA
jgi:hypothetical protein